MEEGQEKKGKWSGGVMILVSEDVIVEKMEYGDGMAKTMSIVIMIKGNQEEKLFWFTHHQKLMHGRSTDMKKSSKKQDKYRRNDKE